MCNTLRILVNLDFLFRMVGWVNIRKEDKEELIEKLGKGEKGLVDLCYLSKFYLLINYPTYLLDLSLI